MAPQKTSSQNQSIVRSPRISPWVIGTRVIMVSSPSCVFGPQLEHVLIYQGKHANVLVGVSEVV